MGFAKNVRSARVATAAGALALSLTLIAGAFGIS